MKCPFCGKEYTSKYGFPNHVRRCPKNPDRILEALTPSGRARKRASAIAQNAQQWSDEVRARHSRAMKRAVSAHPEAYTASNRGRTKQVIVDGIKLQGQWEVDFYIWAKSVGLDPARPASGFQYEWKGIRTYFPDFYLPSKDLYVEVKGYATERDYAKWRDFPKQLIVIGASEIREIRQGTFAGL